MRGSRVMLLLVFGVIACGGETVTPLPPPPPPPPPTPPPPPGSLLLIRGEPMTASAQNVSIFHQGSGVRNATLTVNGTTLDDRGAGAYYGVVLPSVPVGGTVTLSVAVGTLQIEAVGVVPAVPVLGSAAGVTPGQSIDVSWVSPSSPDSFLVGLRYLDQGELVDIPVRLDGDAREAQVPTHFMGSGASGFQIYLHAFNVGTFTGAAAPGSSMHLRNSATPRPYSFGVALQAPPPLGLAR